MTYHPRDFLKPLPISFDYVFVLTILGSKDTFNFKHFNKITIFIRLRLNTFLSQQFNLDCIKKYVKTV